MTSRSPLSLNKRELFAALGYEPHPGQQIVHRSRATRRVLACGSRWGKSTCAAMECIAALLEPRQSARGWVIAPTYDLASRIFDRVVATLQSNLPKRVHDIDLRHQTLTVINFSGGKSELRAKSADNPTSLLGEALDFAVLDEAAAMKQEVWDEHVGQRLLDRDGWALLLSTPRGKANWFHKLYRRGQKGRDPDFESWAAPSSDNPNLSRRLIEAERKRLTPDIFAAQFLAEFIGEDDEPCETCGGPAYGLPRVIIAPEGRHFSGCPDCRGLVDDAGRTLVARNRDGRRATMTILSFASRADGSPRPRPMRCVPDPGSEPRMISSARMDENSSAD